MTAGAYDLSNGNNVYSTTFGPGGGTTTCVNTSRSNASVTTYKSIKTFGPNSIKCTATSKSGLTSTKTVTFNMNYSNITPSMLSANNGATKTTSAVTIPKGGIQFGPYIQANKGCYKVIYYGSNLNIDRSAYHAYDNNSGNGRVDFTISSLNVAATNSNYVLNIHKNTVQGIEFVYGPSSVAGTVTVTRISVSYTGSSC